MPRENDFYKPPKKCMIIKCISKFYGTGKYCIDHRDIYFEANRHGSKMNSLTGRVEARAAK